MRKTYLLAFILFGLMSCQQEELLTNSMYSDDVMSKLKFNTLKVADTRGFGFCDFKWFPKKSEREVEQLLDKDLYKNSFVIQSDEAGNRFVDMELAEKPVALDVNKLQPLVVEEELESYATVDKQESKIVVPQGTYSFDSSIGKFGGYRIPLK